MFKKLFGSSVVCSHDKTKQDVIETIQIMRPFLHHAKDMDIKTITKTEMCICVYCICTVSHKILSMVEEKYIPGTNKLLGVDVIV